MKHRPSFSLLNFLLLATIAIVCVALYQANNEVADSRARFKEYDEEFKKTGFIVAKEGNESMVHVRRLGGYPPMSFAFRYRSPEDCKQTLFVGSGVVDPRTGYPPVVMKRMLWPGQRQGTVVVNLQKMPTEVGHRWTVQVIDNESMTSTICDDPDEFTWLQTYLASYPREDGAGDIFVMNPVGPTSVDGHQGTQLVNPEVAATIYQKDEFHPTAIPTLPPELLKERKTLMIWLDKSSRNVTPPLPPNAVPGGGVTL